MEDKRRIYVQNELELSYNVYKYFILIFYNEEIIVWLNEYCGKFQSNKKNT